MAGEGMPNSVLFCCDHNAVRSPMAEGMMKKFYGHACYVQSAGVFNDMEVDGFAAIPLNATLTGAGQPLMMAASYDTRAHELTVRRTEGPAAEAGKDYELWIIPAGQAPISIGVVRDAALSIPLQELPEGATLAITLETLGGSPTGAPQGPLLVAAVIGDS